MDTLIARLEAAMGPSRELDLRICRDVLDGEPLGHAAGMPDELLLVAQGRLAPMPRYTASLDAALTLVPVGYCWKLRHAYAAQAVVWQIDCEYDEGSGRILPFGEHRTPAIALCIAALKARAAAQILPVSCSPDVPQNATVCPKPLSGPCDTTG
jgi:hypothetical protein